MPSITSNVSFGHIAREWRCKWSADNDKASLAAAQDALSQVLAAVGEVPGVKSIQRVVCGGCLDFKVIVKLSAETFAAWEEAGFAPEAMFLEAIRAIEGVSSVETQTYTLEEVKAPTAYELVYFDIRGLAETARFLFKIANVPFTDTRLSLNFGTPGDFSTITRPEFDAMKAAGELDVSLGKVPLLLVNGVRIGQSKAIERFLAKEFGMMGSTNLEAAMIDQLVCSIQDAKDAYQKVKRESAALEQEAKDAAMAAWFSESLPEWVEKIEKSLPAGQPGPWLVGSSVSYADVSWYAFLRAPSGYFDNTEGALAALASGPRISAAAEACSEIPELQEWIASRPPSMF